jgi:FlaA1/EpsC-like NDP-sugar epimerase
MIAQGWSLACVLALTPVLAGVYLLAYWLRHDGQFSADELMILQLSLPWVIGLKTAMLWWFGVYRGWGRYVTLNDVVSLAEATTGAALLLVLVDYLLFPQWSIPRSVFLTDWGATVLAIGGLRAMWRLFHEHHFGFISRDSLPTLIIGANDSGEELLRSIKRNGSLPYHVVGFIDDDGRRVGTRISGVPVIGTLDETCSLAQRLGVNDVLITAGELPGRTVRQLINDTRDHGVRVEVVPSYEQMLAGRVAMQPRPVSIADLLQREPVQLDMPGIRQWIDDRVLMVTGSAGSIGSEISRQLLQFSPRQIILVDRSENGQFFLERELRELADEHQDIEVTVADITDEPRMRSLLERYRPDVIFHAAAYKHVPLMEANPGEAVKNIALATRTLATLADEYEVGSFVMISSDKAVNPTNVMGVCKRVAELYVQSLASVSDCHFVTVRFGNVLDSAGSVVPIFREQIARGGPVTVTHPDMQRFFMMIPEASQLVIQAGAMGRGGEIFVLDMGEPVKIVDLASDMIRLSGLQVDDDIEIQFTGTRPGEKLYEELHVVGEKHLPTRHSKIMVAEKVGRDLQEVRAAIGRLQEIVELSNETIIEELQAIVPEFRRQGEHQPARRIAA